MIAKSEIQNRERIAARRPTAWLRGWISDPGHHTHWRLVVTIGAPGAAEAKYRVSWPSLSHKPDLVIGSIGTSALLVSLVERADQNPSLRAQFEEAIFLSSQYRTGSYAFSPILPLLRESIFAIFTNNSPSPGGSLQCRGRRARRSASRVAHNFAGYSFVPIISCR